MRHLLFVATLLMLPALPACSPSSEAVVQQSALQGRLALVLPQTWQPQVLGYSQSYQRDNARFYQGTTGCSIQVRPLFEQKAEIRLPDELTALLAKYRGVEIVTSALDPTKRRASIDYRLKRSQHYYKYLIYYQSNDQVRFIFQGPDTPSFRRTVDTIIGTIKLTN